MKRLLILVLLLLTVSVYGQEIRTKGSIDAVGIKDFSNWTSYSGSRVWWGDDYRQTSGSDSQNDAKSTEGLDAFQGTAHFIVRTDFASSDDSTKYVYDGGAVELYWDGGNTRWAATVNGVSINRSDTFSAGDEIYLYLAWDSNAPTLDLSADATAATQVTSAQTVGAVISDPQIGADQNQTSVFSGVIAWRIANSIESSLYSSGNGDADFFVINPDTLSLSLAQDGNTGQSGWHRGQTIASISTVTLTTDDDVADRWTNNKRVLVSDDADPNNSVYTAINGTPSGTTVIVDDSCAVVSDTNKFISYNLLIDPGSEAGHDGAVGDESDADVEVAPNSSIVQYGDYSQSVIWTTAANGDETTLRSYTGVSSQDYWLSYWVYVGSLSADLYVDVDGSANIFSRQLDTGIDDNGTSYATGTWLYYEQCFTGDQNGAHDLNFGLYNEPSISTEQVGDNQDDAWAYFATSAYYDATTTLRVGSHAAGTDQGVAGMRFQTVPVPNAATIVSAAITVTAEGDESGTDCITRIYAEDVDDAAAMPSTFADFNTKYGNRTTAYESWTVPAFADETEYTSPDISSVIQEVVNRGGWASGQDMVIFWGDYDDESSAGAKRIFHAHNGAPSKAPQLDITYAIDNNSATIYVDQMEIRENLLATGDMESGSGDPWLPTGWITIFDAGEMAQETVEQHTGSSCVKYGMGALSNEWLYDLVTLETDQYYTLSFFGKGEVGDETIRIRSTAFGVNYNEYISVTVSWQKFSITFNPGDDASGAVWFGIGTNFDEVFIDDVSLIRCDTADADIEVKQPIQDKRAIEFHVDNQ